MAEANAAVVKAEAANAQAVNRPGFVGGHLI
jgi:hypothetical protein